MRNAQQRRHDLRPATRNPQIRAASLPKYSYFVRIAIQTHGNTHQATHSQQQTVDRTEFVDAVRVDAAEAAVIAEQRTEWKPPTLVDARMPVDAPPWWTCAIARDRTRRSLAQMISHLDLRVLSGESDNTSGPGDARPSISCDARDVHHAAMRKAQQIRHDLRLATRNPQILAASLPKYSYCVRIVIQIREKYAPSDPFAAADRRSYSIRGCRTSRGSTSSSHS